MKKTLTILGLLLLAGCAKPSQQCLENRQYWIREFARDCSPARLQQDDACIKRRNLYGGIYECPKEFCETIKKEQEAPCR